jgi:thiol-disulfide isomerase/thioredoxin
MTERLNRVAFLCIILITLSSLVVIIDAIEQHPQCVLRVMYDFEGALVYAKQKQAHEERTEELRRRNAAQHQRMEEYRRRSEEQKKLQQEASEKRRIEEQQKEEQEKQEKEQQRLKQRAESEKCPYKVLGINKDATQAEVKKAYRTLSLRYHPDKNPGCELSKTMFTKLVDAYDILGDAESRIMHDEEGFGEYQTRPHNFNSQQGFYSGNSLVTPLNMTEFDRHVLCQDKSIPCSPWMVEFYTPWCVHCKNMIPDWKRAASTMDGTETPLGFVNFGGVNCETDKPLCRRLGVKSYPEIHLYAQDAKGQGHSEKYPNNADRTADAFIQFAEKGVRLAHESTLQPIDAFLMHKNVTNSSSTGLWIVLFEDTECGAPCNTLKASIRRMSANIRGLANFGVVDCNVEATICKEQYVTGTGYPVLKMYPYQGVKGTGETLYHPGSLGAHFVLPVVEKVIRLCIANIGEANGLMNTLLEEEEQVDEPPLQQQYQYPQPERQVHYGLPAGVRAGSAGTHYIGG